MKNFSVCSIKEWNKNNETPGITKFVKDNVIDLFIIFCSFICVYGLKLFNVIISHDTEAIISVPEALYHSWFCLGRYGAVYIHKLLGTYINNPSFSSIMSFICLFLNSIMFMYLVCTLLNNFELKNKWIFPVAFFTSRIFVEQNSFLLQSYEITVAMLILCFGFYIFFNFDNILRYVILLIITTFAFSVYQAFVPLYISISCICLLFYYWKNKDDENFIKTGYVYLISLVLILVCSLILYSIINKSVLRVNNLHIDSYISNQIGWTTKSKKECLLLISDHVKNVILGKNIFFPKYFGITLGVFVLITIYDLCKKETKSKFFLVLVLVGTVISPFILTIVLGNCSPRRAEISIPFIVGMILVYIYYRIKLKSNLDIEFSILKYVFVIVVFVILYFQLIDSSRLIYTEYVKYQDDIQVAVKISDRIERLGYGESPDMPVVFCGRRPGKLNSSCDDKKDLELIGYSFYEVSFSTQHGSWVMNHYMDTLGYKYILPSDEQIAKAEIYAKDMKCYPDINCVECHDGIIIVKLGE